MSGAKPVGPGARALLRAFRAEVKCRRIEQGLTRKELGKRSGLTASYVLMVESGKKCPSLSTMLKLAVGLGCGPAELFGTGKLSAAGLEAGRHFEAIQTPAQREAMMKLMRALDPDHMRPAKRPRRRRAT